MRRLDLVVGPNGAGKSTFVRLTLAQALPPGSLFAHPSKVELTRAARAAGYTVVLHVVLAPVELSVARVAHRVAAGGHSVPEDKIRARHARLWPLVVEAARGCDATVFYDNSGPRGPRMVARLAEGEPVGAVTWPDWADPRLPAAWPPT